MLGRSLVIIPSGKGKFTSIMLAWHILVACTTEGPKSTLPVNPETMSIIVREEDKRFECLHLLPGRACCWIMYPTTVFVRLVRCTILYYDHKILCTQMKIKLNNDHSLVNLHNLSIMNRCIVSSNHFGINICLIRRKKSAMASSDSVFRSLLIQ